MQHSEVCHPEWQILVRAGGLVKHDTVAGAVHRLQAKGFLLYADLEHVLRVVVPVAGGLPQLGVVDVGADHLDETQLSLNLSLSHLIALVIIFLRNASTKDNYLLKAAFPILLFDEAQQLVVDMCSFRLEEARPRGELVEEE